MSKLKRKQIRERQRRQKIRTNLIWGTLGIVAVVIIGLFVWQGNRSVASVGEQVEVSPDYVNHIEEGTDPGPFPSDPPAGGRHYASELDAGFYEENSSQTQIAYPEGYIGHNLEHGYVVFWYNCASLSDSDCSTLKSEIKGVMDDFGGTKLIAFPWPSLDVPVAMTSWGRLQRFDSFDPETASAFVQANLNKSPEPNAQ
ncbi:MAG: DUF3105 domain-containing protein [Anaerolineales bacterium]